MARASRPRPLSPAASTRRKRRRAVREQISTANVYKKAAGDVRKRLDEGSQTTRHRSGDIFTDQEDLYHAIAEAIPQIVWTAWPDGTVDYMNRRWFEYTGLTEEETYQETASAVHPDDLPLYRQRWKESIEKQIPYEMEYRFRRASDGEYRWHLGRGLPVRDQGGRLIKWFGTCTEIHQQKEAEAQVRKLNEELEQKVGERTRSLQREVREREKAEESVRLNLRLLQNMIGAMPMAAVAADRNFAILHCNRHFSDMFGSREEPESLVGKHCVALLSEALPYFAPDAQYDRLMRRLSEGALEEFRQELAMRDGRTLHFQYIPIADAGSSHGHLLLFRDITQEKRIDKAKSEFMSLASHQLRTPLTAIRWALSRLSKELGDRMSEREQHLLRRARRSALTMSETIRTMLAISRIEAGMLRLAIAPVNLCAFLMQLHAEFIHSCTVKRLDLQVECSSDITLETDPHMLWEVAKNLITNAIKYTPAGGRISLRGRMERDESVLEVSDTGYGIPMHEQKKIFTKFFRGENVTHIDTEGTGLGLYLISQLIGMIGGKIEFTSQENRGTTFTLRFPAKQQS